MCSPRLLQGRPRARYTGLVANSLVTARGGVGYLPNPARKKAGAMREGFSKEPSLAPGRRSPDMQMPLAVARGRPRAYFVPCRRPTTILKKIVRSFFRCGILPQLPTDIYRGFLVAGYRK